MEKMHYQSTRDRHVSVSASEAILAGISAEGGLFVPERIPALEKPMSELAALDYKELAYEVMKLYLTDYTEEELRECIRLAYGAQFDTPKVAPLKKADQAYYLELYHGPTIAFKDMALQILPHLMTVAAKKNGAREEIVILTATSGDTGKAALAGFADVPGTKIIVYYPKHGVSTVQEMQMVTQKGANVLVAGIEGNFDDAQAGVKRMFTDPALIGRMKQAGYRFSSANSINVGRLIPQVVYYVYAYAQMLREGRIADGDPIHVVVPTGNFGNILAAYYAKRMGVPIDHLFCASNRNKVLYDFFETGVYDRNREFYLTKSPSMDILVSSNLERLIYEICGRDDEECRRLMKCLADEGKYEITEEMRENLKDFRAGFATEEQTIKAIKRTYENAHYTIDTHTAVASSVYHYYRKETGDKTKTVIASTASPFKFARDVVLAVSPDYAYQSDLEMVDTLSQFIRKPLPETVRSLKTAKILHNTVCSKEGMQGVLEDFLGLK
ncbi:MAG: threonine synthase [Lachnospiraceae bacterium]|nr:threonine synthase [Lachnospiraceae bacterium]